MNPICPSSGPGSAAIRSSRSRVIGGGLHEPAERSADPGRQPREQHAGHQRDRSQHAQAGGQQRAAGDAAAADVHLVRGRAQRAARLGAAPVRFLQRVHDVLDHPVLRPDDDRAQGREVGVGGAAVIHRHAEEAGRAERLGVGRDLLQMAAERFLARVDAEHGLKSRRGDPARWRAACSGQRVERLRAEAALEGQVKHPPPLEPRKCFDLATSADHSASDSRRK